MNSILVFTMVGGCWKERRGTPLPCLIFSWTICNHDFTNVRCGCYNTILVQLESRFIFGRPLTNFGPRIYITEKTKQRRRKKFPIKLLSKTGDLKCSSKVFFYLFKRSQILAGPLKDKENLENMYRDWGRKKEQFFPRYTDEVL